MTDTQQQQPSPTSLAPSDRVRTSCRLAIEQGYVAQHVQIDEQQLQAFFERHRPLVKVVLFFKNGEAEARKHR